MIVAWVLLLISLGLILSAGLLVGLHDVFFAGVLFLFGLYVNRFAIEERDRVRAERKGKS